MRKSFLMVLAVTTVGLVGCKKEVKVNPTGETVVNNSNVAEDVQAASVNLNDLPSNALATVNKFYQSANIASYEIKNIPVIGKSYEVKFNDGAEIDFNENGDWHEWSDAKGLPDGVLPSSIKNYITKNYANTFATSIDKEDKKIKVELASDVDLEFDTNGNFLRIDK